MLREQRTKTLDSLGGSLATVSNELKTCDTSKLEKAIEEYRNFKVFVKNNISDTLSLQEARICSLFFKSGKDLESFKANRQKLLQRTLLISGQISKLSDDIHQDAIDENEIGQYLENEKSETARLIRIIQEQLRIYCSAIKEFKLSFKEMEQFVRDHNEGQVPEVQTESEEF